MFQRTTKQVEAVVGRTPVTRLSFKQIAAVVDYVGVSTSAAYGSACSDELDFSRRLSEIVRACGYKGGLNAFHRDEVFWSILRKKAASYGHSRFVPCPSGSHITKWFQTKGAEPLVVVRDEAAYRSTLDFAEQVLEMIYEHEGDRVHRWHYYDTNSGMDVVAIEAEFDVAASHEPTKALFQVCGGTISVTWDGAEPIQYPTLFEFQACGLPRRVHVDEVRRMHAECAARCDDMTKQLEELTERLYQEEILHDVLLKSSRRPSHDNTCLLT